MLTSPHALLEILLAYVNGVLRCTDRRPPDGQARSGHDDALRPDIAAAAEQFRAERDDRALIIRSSAASLRRSRCLLLNYAIAEGAGMNRKFRKFVQGEPSLLVHDGQVISAHMAKEHMCDGRTDARPARTWRGAWWKMFPSPCWRSMARSAFLNTTT